MWPDDLETLLCITLPTEEILIEIDSITPSVTDPDAFAVKKLD